MRHRKRWIAGSGAVVVAASAGVAWAVWSATGTGSGAASTVSANAVTVSATTGGADMWPGGPGGSLNFTVTNTNPYSVTFTQVSYGTVTSSKPLDCPVSGNLIVPTGQQALLVPLAVAAHASATAASIPAAVTLSHGAGDGCQNTTFTVALILSGSQD